MRPVTRPIGIRMGEPGGKTSITVNYYHAPGADKVPTPDYELFETVVLTKRRGRHSR